MISPLIRRTLGLVLLPALAVWIIIRMPVAAAAGSVEAQTEHGVRVALAWIRWLPANLPAGGYLTLVNDSAQPVTLVAVQSAAYASVALHRTLTSGGTARMVPVAAISVPAHSTLDFASLGYHLMLMQARHPVQPGQQLPLTLQFADGGTLQISAQVKPPTWVPPSAHAGATMPGMPGMPGMDKMPAKSH
jgi:hypothetical protein